MAHPFTSSSQVHAQTIHIAQVNHLPIVADFARRLGLEEIRFRICLISSGLEFPE